MISQKQSFSGQSEGDGYKNIPSVNDQLKTEGFSRQSEEDGYQM